MSNEKAIELVQRAQLCIKPPTTLVKDAYKFLDQALAELKKQPPKCKTCGGKGYKMKYDYNERQGEGQKIPCPTCQQPPPVADVAKEESWPSSYQIEGGNIVLETADEPASKMADIEKAIIDLAYFGYEPIGEISAEIETDKVKEYFNLVKKKAVEKRALRWVDETSQ